MFKYENDTTDMLHGDLHEIGDDVVAEIASTFIMFDKKSGRERDRGR